jgi:hypothetical protein
MTNKIAFLFLTLDNPNFPDVWDYYFKGNEDKINIYIHPKYPDKVTWHKENIISDLKETAWGFIVDAYKSLFKTALQDKTNIKFITVSESCLPIKPFNKMYKDIMKDRNESFIKIMPISNYDWSERISTEIVNTIGKPNMIKHYARMCLSRHHIKQLLINKDKLNLFIKMHVGDEFFLSSIMPIKNFKNMAVTHDDWDYVDKQKKEIKDNIRKLYEQNASQDKIKELKDKFNDIAKNPKKIIKVDKEDLDNMKKSESYFYRKFDKTSDIEKFIYKNL